MGSSRKKPSAAGNNVGCLGIMAGLCLAGMVLGLVISLAVVLLVVAIFVGLVALSVYFWKTEDIKLDKKKRAIILVIGWILVLSVASSIATGEAEEEIPSSSVASSTASSAPSSSVAASSEAASSEGAASEADSAPAASSEAASAPASSVEQAASSEAAAVVPAAPSSEAASEPPAESEAQAVMVWIPTHGGTKYHSKATCSGMEDPEQVTLEEAQALGFTPCGRCY